MTLPSKPWAQYETDVKNLGEHRGATVTKDGFLASLGLIDDKAELTNRGKALFQAVWIARDVDAAKQIAHVALLQNPEALAICQLLYGLPNAQKSTVESVLRSCNLEVGLTNRRLGTLLTILSSYEIISYNRGTIRVLNSPFSEGTVPPSVFISRETPFSNQMWLAKVLKECTEHIFWLDKHFQPIGLESILEAADGNAISEIRVLSLKLESNSTLRTRKKYQALQQELLIKGIAFEWRFIDSKLIRTTHDRWVIGAREARNIPDVSTIYSGNNSEISKSEHHIRLKKEFEQYWIQAMPF